MTVMRFLLATVLLASACGGSSTKQISDPGFGGDGAPTDRVVDDPIPTTTGPTTTGPACASVAERIVQVALADQLERQSQVTEALRKRCSEDRWSDAARNCLATIETDDELDGCRSHLSEAQHHAIERDLTVAAEDRAEPATTGTSKSKSKRSPTRRTGADPCEGGE
jgi:hypothetical protein